METNDSYSISITIYNALNSKIACSQKTTYLQELSGYIDLHLNGLELNLTQTNVIITQGQKERDRLKTEIQLIKEEQQGLQVVELRKLLDAKMRQLQDSYQAQLKQGQKVDSLQKNWQQFGILKK